MYMSDFNVFAIKQDQNKQVNVIP